MRFAPSTLPREVAAGLQRGVLLRGPTGIETWTFKLRSPRSSPLRGAASAGEEGVPFKNLLSRGEVPFPNSHNGGL